MNSANAGRPGTPGRLRRGPLLLVLGLYLLSLVTLVAITLGFEVPLSEGGGFLVFPTPFGIQGFAQPCHNTGPIPVICSWLNILRFGPYAHQQSVPSRGSGHRRQSIPH